MSAPTVPRLGAPGIYPVAGRSPAPVLTPVRLDVVGFVGVALRGPIDTPVGVTRWSDFVQRFGGFEPTPEGAQRLLPYAVQAFFAQGGEKAYVVRVTAHSDDAAEAEAEAEAAAATALFRLDVGPGIEVAAADEGTWGNGLSIRIEFDVGRPFRALVPDGGGAVELPAGIHVSPGSLLRLKSPGSPAVDELRWVDDVVPRPGTAAGRDAMLDTAVPGAAGHRLELELITGTVVVEELGLPGSTSRTAMRRTERLGPLGLHPRHPRFARTVLATESLLLSPVGEWDDPLRPPDATLRPVFARSVHTGHDRTSEITYSAFFDEGGADADPLDEWPSHRGVDAMGRHPEIGLICVPDLLWRATGPAPPPPLPLPVPVACCESCRSAAPEPDLLEHPEPPQPLDPGVPAELAEIMRRQQRLVEVADLRRRFIALLDVPVRLSPRGITEWRAAFDTSYAAAYHPWLGVPRVGDPRREIVLVPPSAFAAGIIAARERRLGLPWGPANELADGAVVAADVLTDPLHDDLHALGINVYRAERDGFRLTAARTLSTDPEYRQLTVRRLMTMLALSIDRQLQWLVFEPNTPGLRDMLRRTLTDYLRTLHRRRAFAGDTEASSFFVRCDEGLNPPASQAMGRLLAEVGVAPAAPLEYLLLRVTQDVDGALQVVDESG